MVSALVWTAFVMDLAGGPHCLGMCAAPCAAITSVGKPTSPWSFHLSFHAGRMLGYAALGAVAAAAMQSAAWLSTHTSVLRPLWSLMHAGVLAWGAVLLVRGRQPLWDSDGATWSRTVARLRPLLAQKRAVFATGLLWAAMPCGLLYSALLVAALSGGAAAGATSMALFALGSALTLVAGPVLWRRAQTKLIGAAGPTQQQGRQQALEVWGMRLSGLMLISLASWALWHDHLHDHLMQLAQWCGLTRN